MLISITISASEELEALFESMVMDVESSQFVYQFIQHLLNSSHMFLRRGERIELYVKDCANKGKLKLLDTTMTLYANHIKNKVLLFLCLLVTFCLLCFRICL